MMAVSAVMKNSRLSLVKALMSSAIRWSGLSISLLASSL
jgi:hypothetical protein